MWGTDRVYRNKTTIHPRYSVIARQKYPQIQRSVVNANRSWNTLFVNDEFA